MYKSDSCNIFSFSGVYNKIIHLKIQW